jgi:hypothetical protein
MLIGLGVLLLGHNALPADLHDSPLHAVLILGSIAAFFGTIYAYGRRWARIPAILFGTIAGVVLFSSWPWHWFGFGLGIPFWPLLLIVFGLWVMRRDNRWA